jgi:SAM-dependent methyltransferase
VELPGFEPRDGVWVPSAGDDDSEYRRQWEREAADDHVVSAIARGGGETLEELTAKITPFFDRIPAGGRYGTILDIGAGYGRLALYLSCLRAVRCERYVPVDISEAMLRHLLRYWERFDVFPGAEVVPVRTSAHELPLANASVDLAVTSVVFLHMGRRYVERALREIARVLRPDGAFLFDSSFPNRRSPANLPAVLRGRGAERRPNQVKYYARSEVDALVRDAGLDRYGVRIETAERALLPKAVAGRRIPLARTVNRLVARRGPDSLLGVTFTVSSASLAPASAAVSGARRPRG